MPNDLPEIVQVDRLTAFPAVVEVILCPERVAAIVP
jgi:hypothetical protein